MTTYETGSGAHARYSIDANDGRLYWKYDTLAEVWCPTLVADKKVYLGNQQGVMSIFATDRMKKLADDFGPGLEVEVEQKKLSLKKGDRIVRDIVGDEVGTYFQEVKFHAEIHCSPIVAQGVLYVTTMRHLYAIKAGAR